MATIVYGEALADLGYPPDSINPATFTVSRASGTLLRVTDDTGAGISVSGVGLTYKAGVGVGGAVNLQTLVSGTVTAVTFFDGAKAPLYTVTGLDLSAPLAMEVVVFGDIYPLLAGNDLITGSSGRDIVLGDRGNDTLDGGAGSDFLLGDVGRDRMTGGGGKDFFVFVPNKGLDTVTDFRDVDAAGDDQITMRRGDYAAMTMTQEDDGVLLAIGTKGSLMLLGATVDQLGLDDFSFNLRVLTGS